MKVYIIRYYNNSNRLLYLYGIECEDYDEALFHAENHMSSGIPDRYEIERPE